MDEEQKADDLELYKLTFGVRRSIRYHLRRAGFLSALFHDATL